MAWAAAGAVDAGLSGRREREREDWCLKTKTLFLLKIYPLFVVMVWHHARESRGDGR